MGAPTFDKVWAFAPITGAWIETFIIRANADLFPSHPSRVRGLKREKRQSVHGQLNSHPSRVRGLKRNSRYRGNQQSKFAPITGAWIETLSPVCPLPVPGFAPITGAWIETTKPSFLNPSRYSHPSRVRGLKQT